MLTINKKNFNIKKKNINVSACTYNPETEEVVVILDGEHSVPNNKNIKLFRNLVDGDVFSENFITKSSVVSNGKTRVTIDYKLTDYLLQPSGIESEVRYKSYTGSVLMSSILLFDNIKHIFTDETDIKKISYYLNQNEKISNGCDGFFLYDNIFLYEIKNGVVDTSISNISNIVLKINNDIRHVRCIPLSVNGYYDRTKIILEGNLSDIDLTAKFTANDSRFFRIWDKQRLGKNVEYPSHKNTVLQLSEETLNVNIGIGHDFNTDLQHDVLITDYINEIKGKYASTPQDFEKVLFKPAYNKKIANNKYVNIQPQKITFNVFLRQRHFYEDEMEWKLSTYSDTSKKWEYNEDAMWNSYTYNEGSGKYLYSGDTEVTGDLLGDLGFDDNDVLNQNKRLGKTFIRLLFFDTKDRATQTLLFYSTIFINTTEMYSKLMKNITSHQKKQTDEDYVSIVNENKDLQLTCSFSCCDKNNMNQSSEGFYVYLFPSLIDKLKDENNISTIYMRVEFNHAKYGKTIPLVFRDKPLKNYTKDENNVVNTDLAELYDDMYMSIHLLKNEYGEFFWLYDGSQNYNGNENNPVFSLWEPKIR
jgi:hypothetical protein